MTAPIARTVVNRQEELSFPLRLSYFAPVYRYDMPQVGKNREIYQMGLEFIGGSSFSDAEAIITAVEAIKSTGIKNFKIDLGHVGYLEGIIEEMGLTVEKARKVKQYLIKKDFVTLQTFLENQNLSGKKILQDLPLLRGDKSVLDKAEQLVENKTSCKAVSKLREIYEYLVSYEVDSFVNFDFSLIRGMDYYTGMIFEGFTEKLGYTICGGGRYDNLLARYGGSEIPAVGFALGIQRIALALEKTKDAQLDGLILFSAENRIKALETARRLHEQNYRIIIEENGHTEKEIIKLAREKGIKKILSFVDSEKIQQDVPEIVVTDVTTEKKEKLLLTEGWEDKVWEK